jgi:chromosome segregation ATPase
MFPAIEERGGEGMPTTSDFSQIVELQQFRKLYEEQEEKTRLRLSEKDEEIAELHTAIRARDQQIEELGVRMQELAGERDKVRGDYTRLRQEAQEKIDKLLERIKELNQRLVTEPDKKTGMFGR